MEEIQLWSMEPRTSIQVAQTLPQSRFARGKSGYPRLDKPEGQTTAHL